MSAARIFLHFSYKKYLPVFNSFLSGASYIEQSDSVPGESGACRFSSEKPVFPNTFLEILGCSSSGAIVCRLAWKWGELYR